MMQFDAMTRVSRLTLAVAVGALALAACSKKPAADQTATTATPAADTATPAATTDMASNTAAPAATPAATPAASGAPAADNTDTISGVKYASYTGDATKGQADFLTCKTCHAIEAGVNKIGPSLHDVVGRKAGMIAGYSYSAANKGSGITWTPEKLFQYLEKPQRVVPGTKMTFVGFPDPQKRADVIAYLKAN